MKILGSLVIAAAVVAVFHGIVGHEFLYGWDDWMIYDNGHLHALSWANLRWMFTDTSFHPRHVYMPLAWLWWCLVDRTMGLSPDLCHGLNVAWHALDAVLVFFLLRRLLRIYNVADRVSGSSDRFEFLIAAAATLFWALNPLRAEPVAWAITQKFLIATAFALVGTFCWLDGMEAYASHERSARWRYAAAFGAYVASLLFYPLALSLPGVWFLLAGARAGVGWRRAAGAIAPLVAVGILVSLPPLLAHGSQAAPGPGLLRLCTEYAYVWTYYVWKPFWPSGLTPVPCTFLDLDPLGGPFLASFAALAAITIAAVAVRRTRPWILIFWLCHLCLLVPFLGPGQEDNFPSDRYSYLQGICLSAFLALALSRLPWPRWPRAALAGLLAGVLAVLALAGRASAAEIEIWKNDETFFTYSLAHLEGNKLRCILQFRLAQYYGETGRTAQARALLVKAARGPEVDPGNLIAIADYLETLKDIPAAAEVAALALHRQPTVALVNLSLRLNGVVGNRKEFIEDLKIGIKLKPDVLAADKLASLLAEDGRKAEALAACDVALRLDPKDRQALALRTRLTSGR